MVYTLTLNPALDYIVKTDDLSIGKTNRSRSEDIQFGGKGINVSYVLHELGVESVALGFVAGFTGDELIRQLLHVGIKTDFIKLKKGNTRINVKLKGYTETEINASGPKIPKEALDELYKKLDHLCNGDTLVLSGSVPPSVSADVYEQIMSRLQQKGVRFVVDASNDVLLNTLKYNPFLIKPNVAELQETLGQALTTDDEIISAALILKNKGAENVLVSRGDKGAILVDQNGRVYKASAIKLNAVNTVGAGDSMVAGFIAGVGQGMSFEQALKLSLASASATAASERLATKEEIENFLNI